MEALREVSPAEDRQRARISGWIYDQNRNGVEPIIQGEDARRLLSLTPFQFLERAKRLLLYVADNTTLMGQQIELDTPRVHALLATFHLDEILYVEEYLAKQGWTEAEGPLGSISCITAEGWIQVDSWRAATSDSVQAFVAMWFQTELDPAWRLGFEPGIRAAGYEPLRVDLKEHRPIARASSAASP